MVSPVDRPFDDNVFVDGSREGRLVDFYSAADEPTRLFKREGRIELLRTQRLVEAALPPPPARILDIGGGDGVYARWLIDLGFDVELLDITPAHVEAARSSGITAHVGDARNLPFESHSCDAVLLLGPLYHLTDSQDRQRSLREALRVLKPSGVIAASAVNRLSVAVDLFRKGRLGEDDALAAASVIARNGYDDTGYGAGLFYFHSPRELADEVRSAGFDGVRVHGLEGPAWPLIDASSIPDDTTVHLAAAIADLADDDEAAAAASAHLLAVGKARDRS
jgi:SAM-dependent methyltransferase